MEDFHLHLIRRVFKIITVSFNLRWQGQCRYWKY